MGQLKGIPNKQRYCSAKTITNHYSDFSYFHLYDILVNDYMVQAKKPLKPKSRR